MKVVGLLIINKKNEENSIKFKNQSAIVKSYLQTCIRKQQQQLQQIKFPIKKIVNSTSYVSYC